MLPLLVISSNTETAQVSFVYSKLDFCFYYRLHYRNDHDPATNIKGAIRNYCFTYLFKFLSRPQRGT